MGLIEKPLAEDGRRAYKVILGPALEPVTVAELKTFSRITYTEEDTLLQNFITASREATEEYLGRALMEQTIRMLMDSWPGEVIKLPKPPLISITKVATLDEDDVETVYDSSNYYIITEAVPGRLMLRQSASPPVNANRNYGGFLIEFKAGYGDEASDVPRAIREGIMLWVAAVHATRAFDPKSPPPEARSKLDLFRVVGVMIR